MADVAVPYAVVVVIGGVGCDLLTRSIDRIVVIEDTGVRLAVICTVYVRGKTVEHRLANRIDRRGQAGCPASGS